MQLHSKTSDEVPPRSNGNAELPSNGLIGDLNGSRPFGSRLSYLKILALSLLREIASAENTEEDQGEKTIDLQAEVRRFEMELIRSALIQTAGCQRQAARLLGTKVTTLNTKIKRYKIEITSAAPQESRTGEFGSQPSHLLRRRRLRAESAE